MKRLIFLSVILMYVSCQSDRTGKTGDVAKDPGFSGTMDYPIQPVPFTSVRVNDEFWTPRIKTNKEVTLPYTFQKSDETGRLRNFAIAGGMEEGEFEGIFFNDSDVFKIIEGASYTLQVEDDPELKRYLDDLITKIAAAQEEDGYLYTNRTIDPEKAADGAGEERWTNLAVYHELYNVGHMYEAAVAHYLATGERTFLDVALKNADLLNEVFGPGKNMGVPGHQEIEMGLVKLFRVTGDLKYLKLAKFFVDQRGNEEGHELFGEYCQDHKLFAEQEEAVGHAVRACYFYSGATDVAALTGTVAYDSALLNIWKDIVYRKIYLTGGIGAERQHEGFGPAYELPNATAYTETCAAIALMFWNHRLFLRSGEVKYMDVFERILYNGAVKDNSVYVNLYMSNEANFEIEESKYKLRQETGYPWGGNVKITIESEIPEETKFLLRIPGWLRNEVMPGDLYSYVDDESLSYSVSVNGKNIEPAVEDGYLIINGRSWKAGDQINLGFDMEVRKVVSNEKVEANINKMALERGPIVFCAEQVDNQMGVTDLSIQGEASFVFDYDSELLGGLGTITGNSLVNNKEESFKAIPYYAWAHREMGEMAVWLSLD
jgi:DUF1680 family protein